MQKEEEFQDLDFENCLAFVRVRINNVSTSENLKNQI
jgi:hypothetical protein